MVSIYNYHNYLRVNLLYEGGLKIFRPSLRETRDKQSLIGNRTGVVSPPHYEYEKAFLVAAHGSMSIGGSKVKSSRHILELM